MKQKQKVIGLKVSKRVQKWADTYWPEITEALNNALVTVSAGPQPPTDLPVVTFSYPVHGRGTFTTRFVRVIDMTDKHLHGLEIKDEFDDEPGTPKTYLVEKIRGGDVRLLRLAPETE